MSVSECVDEVLYQAFTGVPAAQTTWDAMDRDESMLIESCQQVVKSPTAQRVLKTHLSELTSIFPGLVDHAETAVTAAISTTLPATTTTRPIPTSTIPRVPPSIQIYCPSFGDGNWEWYDVEFGYAFNSYAPIVEWGMDYGDGRSFRAHSEDSAESDLYWHRYSSPGVYLASAWVIDENGLRDDASCTWGWHQPPPVANVQPLLPAGGGCDPNYTGCVPIASDVDCAGGSGNGPAYTGTVQVIGVDIYDLDGDGDGWACE